MLHHSLTHSEYDEFFQNPETDSLLMPTMQVYKRHDPDHLISPPRKRARTSNVHHRDEFSDDARSRVLNGTHFPFLKLPPEIRNEIYRLLLLTKHVVKRRANPVRHNCLAESEPMLHPFPPQALATGEIRSRSYWEYTLKFQLSILRVNRRIYEEASGIFQGENSWIIVSANKKGFGEDLKDHGYAVVYCEPARAVRSIHHIIEHPVMKLSINFAGPEPYRVKDIFIMTTAGIGQLPRALWTLQDSHLMTLFYDSSPDFVRYPAAAKKVVRAFSQLWRPSIGIPNISKDHRSPNGRIRLPNSLPDLKPDELGIPAQLVQASLVIRNYCGERKYAMAAHHGELAMAFLADCYKVYGQRMNYSFDHVRNTAEKIVSIAMSLAEIEFVLGNFKAVDRYCSYTLRMSNLLFRLPRPVNVVRALNRDLARALLLRGQSRVQLRERISAMQDFRLAEELMPGDAGFRQHLKAVVMRCWADAPAELQTLRNLRIAAADGDGDGDGEGKGGGEMEVKG